MRPGSVTCTQDAGLTIVPPVGAEVNVKNIYNYYKIQNLMPITIQLIKLFVKIYIYLVIDLSINLQ